MKVLLVDDSPVDRVISEAFLLELGHEVILGENGQQALELYREFKPDIILMDEVMPIMRGHEAARAIREHEDNWIPIIFLSARFTAEDIKAGIDAGGDDYLAKPLDQKILAAKMKAMERIAKMRQKLLEVSEELEKANIELQRQVDVDGLTGLANRRYLDRFLSHEVARCARSAQPLSVIMCDIDEFKRYNDHYGHLKGDDCIKMIANALTVRTRRATDLAARFGGEEFVLILPNTTGSDAIKVAQKIRDKVEALNIMHEKSSVTDHVTLSMGIYNATPTSMMRSEDFLHLADQALYHAKQNGRNKVTNYSDIESSGRAIVQR